MATSVSTPILLSEVIISISPEVLGVTTSLPEVYQSLEGSPMGFFEDFLGSIHGGQIGAKCSGDAGEIGS